MFEMFGGEVAVPGIVALEGLLSLVKLVGERRLVEGGCGFLVVEEVRHKLGHKLKVAWSQKELQGSVVVVQVVGEIGLGGHRHLSVG
jgi:hypothetical protein